MSAVFAGEKGSFAELAAREYFGASYRIRKVVSFDEVFGEVLFQVVRDQI